MSTKAGKLPLKPGTKAFTLVEVLIATSLACLLVAAIVSALGFVIRSQYSIANYCKMDQEARKALELFGRDIKQCSPTDATSPLSFTYSDTSKQTAKSVYFAIPDPNDSNSSVRVTYAFTPSDSSRKGVGTLRRTVGNAPSQVLIENVTEFMLMGSAASDTFYKDIGEVNANKSTIKQLQLQLTTANTAVITRIAGASTQQILSAQYTIRRKK